MKNSSHNYNTSKSEVTGLIAIYLQAVKNFPFLKYSWIIIATICLLALTAYFKLKNSDVFFYAFGVLIVSLFGFLFSYLLKTKDPFVKFLLYILLSTIVLTIGTAVLGFGSFIIWEKPKFFVRWFPNYTDTSNKVPHSDSLPKIFPVVDTNIIAKDTIEYVNNDSLKTPEELNALAEAAIKIEDYSSAVHYYSISANMGNSIGQYKFGQMYEFGYGVIPNQTEAVKWYIKSANQNNAAGQFKLGWAYEHGSGVNADTIEAVKWYWKSADQGDDFAQFALGFLYEKGKGIPQDLEEAAHLYRKAAEQGNDAAENNLGVMYELGRGGLQKNINQAIIWYKKAASKNNQNAIANLKRVQPTDAPFGAK
jgi:tetratricopeptide (TPR) repeat protein